MKTLIGGWCAVVLVMLLLNITLRGLATEYVVEFWGTFVKKVPVDVPFIPCAVAGLFLGEITIPAAAATWVISFIL